MLCKRYLTLFIMVLFLLSTLSSISMSEKDIKMEAENKMVENELYQSDYELQRVVVQPNATVGKDTYIREILPDYNYGSAITSGVGIYPEPGEMRSLLQFDLPDNIGIIKDATLSVHGSYSMDSEGLVNIKVHPLLNEWEEGVEHAEPGAANWTYRTVDETWDTPGGDFDEGIYSYREPSLLIDYEDVWYSWDITNIAKRWESGELENYGVIMVPDGVSDPDFFLFYTSEYVIASSRPKLTITYHAEIDPPLENQTLEMNGPPEVIDLAGRERGDLERLSQEGYDSVNSIPFYGPYSEMRYQNLYPQEEIGVTGDITRISFNRSDFNEIGNFSDFKMSLGHSTLDSLTDTFDDNYEGMLYEVFSRDNLMVNSSNSDSWVHFELDTAFPYDGSRNLLIDIQWIGSGGNSVGLQAFNHGSNRRVFSDSVTSPTGMADGTSVKAKFGVEVTDGAHFFWEGQSLDPDMFKAEVLGTELTINPMPNARGVGTLALSLFNNNGHYVTQEVDVIIGMKDAFITDFPDYEHRNHGGYEYIPAGRAYDEISRHRGLLEFNLPPEEGRLKRASVSLYCDYITQPGLDVNVTLSPITDPWFENDLIGEPGSVNWYNRTETHAWDTPGGDFDTSYISYRNISQNYTWYDWDITEIVRAWYDGDMENNGLMIRGDDHGVDFYNFVAFKSTDHEDSHHWPKVSISFGPEEIPDQYMEENEPTRTIPLGTSYGVTEGKSGGNGGSSNVPFDGENQDESHCQTLYTPELVGGEGTIKRISFGRYYPSQVGIFKNLTISLAHTELDELTETFADNYHGLPVEVFSVEKYETNSSDDDPWIHFELNESFTYDSSYNLLVDLQWQGDNGVKVNTNITTFSNYFILNTWDISSPTGALSTSLPITKFETEVADVGVIDKGTAASWYYWFGSLPFNSGAFPEIRYQILQRSELLNASGTVDKIRFQAFTDGTDWSVVENLSIRMAHSSNESLGTNFEANRIDDWEEVLNRTTYTLASEKRGEWVEIDLDNLFRYNGEDNMVVDIRWRGGHAKSLGINLTVDNTVTYNGVLGYADYNAETGETIEWMHNIQTIFVDEPRWEATSSDTSLFTAEVIDGNLEITPQPDQHGSGYIDLRMSNCNGHLVHQQDIMVTITELNDPPDPPSNPSPADGAVDVSTSPLLTVDVSDPDGDTMNVTFYNASDDSVIGTDNDVASGSTASVTWSGLSMGMVYEWYAVADDGIEATQSVTWSFTTTDANHAPDVPTNPIPVDGAQDVSTAPTLSVDVSDPDGDTMNVTFYDASDDSVFGTDNSVASGSTASVTWSGLSLNETYEWYAVADDGQDTTQSATWNFTTILEEDTEPPVAIANADKTSIYIGETVNFDGSASTDNVGIVRYTWIIDGEEHDGVTVSYTFEDAGNYTITLTVEDAAGNVDEDTIYVLVTERDEDEALFPMWWLLVLIAVIVIILILVVALKKRGSEGDYTMEEEPYQESYAEDSPLDDEQFGPDEGIR